MLNQMVGQIYQRTGEVHVGLWQPTVFTGITVMDVQQYIYIMSRLLKSYISHIR